MKKNSGLSNKKNTSVKVKPQVNDSGVFVGNIIKLAFSVILILIVFIPPFIQGLYPEKYQLQMEVFVLVVFCGFWVYKWVWDRGTGFKSPISITSLCLLISYVVSLFAAVSTRSAFGEILKYCMYLAVFFMISDLARVEKIKRSILWTFAAAAAGVSMLGIDAGAGGKITNVVNNILSGMGIRFQFSNLFFNPRIYSSIQYPDTTAAFLLAAFLITIGLTMMYKRRYAQLLSSGLSFIILLAFIFTKSRGGLLLLPVAVLVLFITMLKGNRVKSMVYLFIPFIPAALLYGRISTLLTGIPGHERKILLYVFVGTVVSGGLAWGVRYIDQYLDRAIELVYKKVRFKTAAIIGGGALVVIAILAVVICKTTGPIEMSHGIQEPDSQKSIQRYISLAGGREYILSVTLDAQVQGKNPEAYSIDISNISEGDYYTGRSSPLTHVSGGQTQGRTTKEIHFKVPEKSRYVLINLLNSYNGTSVKVTSMKVLKPDTKSVIQSIPLKYKFIGNKIADAVQSFWHDNSVVSRMMFYKDASKMIKDYPLLGAGGGAWPTLYFKYQSYLYPANEVHSFPLQVLTDTGLLGFAALMGFIVSIVIVCFKTRKMNRTKNDAGGLYNSILISACLILFLHSVIDFDFSLPAMFLFFWEVLALINAGFKSSCEEITASSETMNKNITAENSRRWSGVAVYFAGIGFTLVAFVFSVLFVRAYSFSEDANKAVKNGQLPNAISLMGKAASLDPFKAEYKIDFASLLLAQDSVSSEDSKKAGEQVKKAEKLGKNKSSVMSQVAKCYFSEGDIAKCLSSIDRSVYLMPLNPDVWEKKVNAYMQVMLYYYNKGDNAKGFDYLNKALAIADEAKAVNKCNYQPFKFTVNTYDLLEKLYYAKKGLEAGTFVNIDKIAFYSINNLDVDMNGVPDQWDMLDGDNSKISRESGFLGFENLKEESVVRSRRIMLKPQKKYVLQVEMANADEINSLSVSIPYIGDRIDLKKNGNVFSTSFVTNPGIENSTTYIEIFIKSGYRIKNVTLQME